MFSNVKTEAKQLGIHSLMTDIQLPPEYKLRHGHPSDQLKIVKVMTDWWGGRDLSHMLPRVFLEHFRNTSFIIEKEGYLVAFLVGFYSQSQTDEAHIHFVGVHPEHRKAQLGRFLYQQFFQLCRQAGRTKIRATTSPVNKGSIRFHQKMGFEILRGNAFIDEIPATNDYNKPGDPKVLFLKSLDF